MLVAADLPHELYEDVVVEIFLIWRLFKAFLACGQLPIPLQNW